MRAIPLAPRRSAAARRRDARETRAASGSRMHLLELSADECEIPLASDDGVVLLFFRRRARNFVFEVDRDRASVVGMRDGGGIPRPVDHAFTDRTALDLPGVALRILVPIKIFHREHLQTR